VYKLERKDVKNCEVCKNEVLDELMNPTVTANEKGEAIYLFCAVCALGFRNRIHGLPPGTPFTGPKALELFEKTLEHYKQTQQKIPQWALEVK
jgi:hypothetical protein